MITTTTTTTTETMQSPHDHSCFPPLRAVLHPVLVLVMFVPVCTCDYFVLVLRLSIEKRKKNQDNHL